MPSRSATSFWVRSRWPPRPKRSMMMRFSRAPRCSSASRRISRSISWSRLTDTVSGRVPSTSLKSSSFPSQSVLSGSSRLTSSRSLEVLRRNIRISFSMQRLA